MSTSSLSRWGTTALVVVLLGGFVTWLALPWIKSDPPENAGVVYLPTPENLPRNADAWYMLLREAEMPEDWHEQVVPTDDTTAIRTCRGTLNDGRAGFASTDWGSFTASQPVEMSESILIFLSDPDAERYVRNVPNVTACEAQLFDKGKGNYREGYDTVHRSRASVAPLATTTFGSETFARTLSYDVNASGAKLRVYDDRIAMRLGKIVYEINVVSSGSADDATAKYFAGKATQKIGLPLPPPAASAPAMPVSPPPTD